MNLHALLLKSIPESTKGVGYGEGHQTEFYTRRQAVGNTLELLPLLPPAGAARAACRRAGSRARPSFP